MGKAYTMNKKSKDLWSWSLPLPPQGLRVHAIIRLHVLSFATRSNQADPAGSLLNPEQDFE